MSAAEAGTPIVNLRDLADLPPTLSIDEAAKILGIGRGLGYQMARSGTLPGVLQLGRNRYRVATATLLHSIGVENAKVKEDS